MFLGSAEKGITRPRYSKLWAFLETCGFRGKAGGITGSIRSALRNGSDHDYGMNPIADSDFKPITWGHLSEP